MKKQWYKIVSAITAIALIISSLSGLTMVSAADTSSTFDLQAIVDANDISVSNYTSETDLEDALTEIALPEGYEFSSIESFYKVNAFNGAMEQNCNYTGAPAERILVEGEDGYISAVVGIATADDYILCPLTITIKHQMKVYTGADLGIVSNDISDWTGDNSSGWKYNIDSDVDIMIIPDEITKLATDWHDWQSFKVIIYGEGLTTIGRAAYMGGTETVSFKGEVETIGALAFMNATALKYIRLPDTVKEIGAEAFLNCKSLEQLYIPEGVINIGQAVLAKYNDDSGHNLTEVIIPSTVAGLYFAEGHPTFLGALQDCTFTILSKEDFTGKESTFYLADNTKGEKNSIRVWKGSSADEVFAVAEGCTKTYIDDMGTAEAMARSASVIKEYSGNTYITADAIKTASVTMLEEISAAYWNVEAITVSLKDANWTLDGDYWTNTLVYSNTNDELTVEVPVSVLAEFDFAATAESIAVTNDTTAESLLADLETLQANGGIPEGFTMEITDFYKLSAFNGAIERGSTYTGAPTEDVVLVPGEDGYITATIVLTSAAGSEKSYTVTKTIDPTYAVYSFASVSSDSDFTIDANGQVTNYTGSAEKVVFPDNAITMATLDEKFKGNTKCVVFGKNMTSTGRSLWGTAEVVSFAGDKITRLGGLSFYGWSNLKYIRMPDSVTQVDAEIFRFNSVMEQLYLSKNLERINNGSMFFKSSDTGFHNLKEINIPASVTYIVADAFAGAGQECVVNIWTKSNNLWNANVFYNTEAPERGEKYTLRVWNTNQASGTADKQYAYAEGKKQYLDDMTFAEVIARTTKAAEDIKGTYYADAAAIAGASDAIKAQLTASYGDISKYTASWKYDTWADVSIGWENVLVLSNGTSTYEIDVAMSGAFDLQSKIEEAGIVIGNTTTEESLIADIKAAGILSEDVTATAEIYMKEAFNGAVERGSTYEGAPTEDVVLVEPSKGYYAIAVTITTPKGISTTATLLGDIEPHIEYYSFASISKDSDWTIDASGVITGYSGSAEKIVVPDTAVSNQGSALDWKINGKCLVMGKNVTQWNRMLATTVEVVYFPEDCKITTINNLAFAWSSTLKYIKMPDTVTFIGSEAFCDDTSLEQFYISKNIGDIGSNILAKPGTSHKVRRIIIPESNTALYSIAFVGGTQNCEITVLSTAQYWNANAFYDGTNGANNVLKVYSGTSAASLFNTAYGNKLYIDQLATSAAGLAYEKAQEIVGNYTENAVTIKEKAEEIKGIITGAYGNSSVVKAEWASEEWGQEGFNLTNTLVLTGETAIFEIPINIDTESGYYAGAATILTTDEFRKNSNKQGLRMHFFYDSSAVDKISIDGTEYTIKEYGVILKHISDTYAGAAAIDEASFVKGAEGVITQTGDFSTVITHTENSINEYTAIVKNVPQGGKDYTFQYRGYITYTDGSGAEQTVYTETDYSSVQNIYNVVGSGSDYSAMNDWFTGAVLS